MAREEVFKLRVHPRYGYKFVSPTPTEEEIAQYYAEEFYASEAPIQVNDSSLDVQRRDQAFYESWRNDLADIIESHFGSNDIAVFDFGCGWCETLRLMRDRGMRCYGLDTAPEAIAYGKSIGLEVRVSDLKVINPFDRKFDVLIVQNVLEHLSNAESFVEQAAEDVLVPGGLLIIDVPNEFNALQLTGREVNSLDEWWVAPPAHLNYFSRVSLRALVEDKGFHVVDEIASFPLEIFLLMGRNYVGEPELGRKCHEERMLFEENLRKTGRTKVLHDFYRALAAQGLGRQILMVAERGP